MGYNKDHDSQSGCKSVGCTADFIDESSTHSHGRSTVVHGICEQGNSFKTPQQHPKEIVLNKMLQGKQRDMAIQTQTVRNYYLSSDDMQSPLETVIRRNKSYLNLGKRHHTYIKAQAKHRKIGTHTDRREKNTGTCFIMDEGYNGYKLSRRERPRHVKCLCDSVKAQYKILDSFSNDVQMNANGIKEVPTDSLKYDSSKFAWYSETKIPKKILYDLDDKQKLTTLNHARDSRRAKIKTSTVSPRAIIESPGNKEKKKASASTINTNHGKLTTQSKSLGAIDRFRSFCDRYIKKVKKTTNYDTNRNEVKFVNSFPSERDRRINIYTVQTMTNTQKDLADRCNQSCNHEKSNKLDIYKKNKRCNNTATKIDKDVPNKGNKCCHGKMKNGLNNVEENDRTEMVSESKSKSNKFIKNEGRQVADKACSKNKKNICTQMKSKSADNTTKANQKMNQTDVDNKLLTRRNTDTQVKVQKHSKLRKKHKAHQINMRPKIKERASVTRLEPKNNKKSRYVSSQTHNPTRDSKKKHQSKNISRPLCACPTPASPFTSFFSKPLKVNEQNRTHKSLMHECFRDASCSNVYCRSPALCLLYLSISKWYQRLKNKGNQSRRTDDKASLKNKTNIRTRMKSKSAGKTTKINKRMIKKNAHNKLIKIRNINTQVKIQRKAKLRKKNRITCSCPNEYERNTSKDSTQTHNASCLCPKEYKNTRKDSPQTHNVSCLCPKEYKNTRKVSSQTNKVTCSCPKEHEKNASFVSTQTHNVTCLCPNKDKKSLSANVTCACQDKKPNPPKDSVITHESKPISKPICSCPTPVSPITRFYSKLLKGDEPDRTYKTIEYKRKKKREKKIRELKIKELKTKVKFMKSHQKKLDKKLRRFNKGEAETKDNKSTCEKLMHECFRDASCSNVYCRSPALSLLYLSINKWYQRLKNKENQAVHNNDMASLKNKNNIHTQKKSKSVENITKAIKQMIQKSEHCNLIKRRNIDTQVKIRKENRVTCSCPKKYKNASYVSSQTQYNVTCLCSNKDKKSQSANVTCSCQNYDKKPNHAKDIEKKHESQNISKPIFSCPTPVSPITRLYSKLCKGDEPDRIHNTIGYKEKKKREEKIRELKKKVELLKSQKKNLNKKLKRCNKCDNKGTETKNISIYDKDNKSSCETLMHECFRDASCSNVYCRSPALCMLYLSINKWYQRLKNNGNPAVRTNNESSLKNKSNIRTQKKSNSANNTTKAIKTIEYKEKKKREEMIRELKTKVELLKSQKKNLNKKLKRCNKGDNKGAETKNISIYDKDNKSSCKKLMHECFRDASCSNVYCRSPALCMLFLSINKWYQRLKNNGNPAVRTNNKSPLKNNNNIRTQKKFNSANNTTKAIKTIEYKEKKKREEKIRELKTNVELLKSQKKNLNKKIKRCNKGDETKNESIYDKDNKSSCETLMHECFRDASCSNVYCRSPALSLLYLSINKWYQRFKNKGNPAVRTNGPPHSSKSAPQTATDEVRKCKPIICFFSKLFKANERDQSYKTTKYAPKEKENHMKRTPEQNIEVGCPCTKRLGIYHIQKKSKSADDTTKTTKKQTGADNKRIKRHYTDTQVKIQSHAKLRKKRRAHQTYKKSKIKEHARITRSHPQNYKKSRYVSSPKNARGNKINNEENENISPKPSTKTAIKNSKKFFYSKSFKTNEQDLAHEKKLRKQKNKELKMRMKLLKSQQKKLNRDLKNSNMRNDEKKKLIRKKDDHKMGCDYLMNEYYRDDPLYCVYCRCPALYPVFSFLRHICLGIKNAMGMCLTFVCWLPGALCLLCMMSLICFV